MEPSNGKGQADAGRERLLDQLAETLERVAGGQEESAALRSCLARFDEADRPAADAERALEDFRERHRLLMSAEDESRTPEKRHPARKFLRRVVAAAAAAALFCTLYIAGASDGGSTGVTGRWTDETFHFGGIGGEGRPDDADRPVTEGEYDSMEAALAECGIAEPVFPKWIPERFQLERIYVRKGGSRFCAACAEYSREGSDRIFYIDIKRYYHIEDSYSGVYEKDDSPVIEYVSNGITHYFLKNPAGDAVVWNNGNVVCSAVGDLSEEEFQKVVDSIYEEQEAVFIR